MKSYLYIINPISGKGRGKKVVPLIKSKNNSTNIVQIIETEYPRHATEIVKKLNNYPDIIISVGGDGTLNEIVNGIELKNKISICVLPVGSGNDFIKNFNYDKKINDVLSFIHSPSMHHSTRCDIGEINYMEKSSTLIKSHKFINNSGIGFDAQVGYLKQKNTKLNGIFSYLYAVIKALFNYNMIDTELIFNNTSISGRKLMISLGNGISSGGGFYLNPKALIDDGLIDLTIFDQVTRRRLLTALPMALFNRVDNIPEASLFKSNKFNINLSTPTFLHCDGEIISNNLKSAEINIQKNVVNFISKK